MSILSILSCLFLVVCSDTLALAQSGLSGAENAENGTTDLLNLLCSFKYEREYAVWDVVISAASELRHIIDDDDELAVNFAVFMRGYQSQFSCIFLFFSFC